MLALEAYRLGEISKAKLKEVASVVEINSEHLYDFIASVEASDDTARPAMVQ